VAVISTHTPFQHNYCCSYLAINRKSVAVNADMIHGHPFALHNVFFVSGQLAYLHTGHEYAIYASFSRGVLISSDNVN